MCWTGKVLLSPLRFGHDPPTDYFSTVTAAHWDVEGAFLQGGSYQRPTGRISAKVPREGIPGVERCNGGSVLPNTRLSWNETKRVGSLLFLLFS